MRKHKLFTEPISGIPGQVWCIQCGKFTQHSHVVFTHSSVPDHWYTCVDCGYNHRSVLADKEKENGAK